MWNIIHCIYGIEVIQVEHSGTCWVRFIEPKDRTAVLLTVSKNFSIGMHSNFYELVWFKLNMMVNRIILYIFVLVLVTLNFMVWESKHVWTNYHTKFLSNWIEIGLLLKHVGQVNLILILSCLLNIWVREPCLGDSVNKV